MVLILVLNDAPVHGRHGAAGAEALTPAIAAGVIQLAVVRHRQRVSNNRPTLLPLVRTRLGFSWGVAIADLKAVELGWL